MATVTTANSSSTATTLDASASRAGSNTSLAEEKRGRIARLLGERSALRGLCRAVGVTRQWLWGLLGQGFEAVPEPLPVQPVSCPHEVLSQRLEVQGEALASCGQKKAHTPWAWIALAARTRQIMAFPVGDRSPTRAASLWAKRPHA